jgi:hypothetical protein
MENPISLIKQTREKYDKELKRIVTEVQVDISGAPKTWMPIETLIALTNLNNDAISIQDGTL